MLTLFLFVLNTGYKSPTAGQYGPSSNYSHSEYSHSVQILHTLLYNFKKIKEVSVLTKHHRMSDIGFCTYIKGTVWYLI